MANVTISGISTEQTTAPSADDWLELETSGGVSKKIKLSTLFAYRSVVGTFGMGFSLPAKALELNGALISRTTYASLWTYVNANYSPITKTAWDAGAVGNFNTGDGSTTFGLPDFRGLFPRFAGTNSVRKLADAVTFFNGGSVFSVANDMFQNHTIDIENYDGTDGKVVTGSSGSNVGYLNVITGTTAYTSTLRRAPAAYSTYGTPRVGGETAPASASLVPFVYYAD